MTTITDEEREALEVALTLLRRSEARRHGSDTPLFDHARSALAKCNAALESRPIATCSKARAEEIVAEAERRAGEFDSNQTIEALDRAGAFPGEAALKEIDEVARALLGAALVTSKDNAWTDLGLWRNAALRLATACRETRDW